MPDKRYRIAVVCSHGGSGQVPATLEHLRERYDVVDVIELRLPRWFETLRMVTTFRPNRRAWYRRWRWACEKTPAAFRLLTQQAERRLAKTHDHDLVIQFGALHAPGTGRRRYLILSDSTRRLSSSNSNDPQGRFSNRRMADWWLARESEVLRGAACVVGRSRRVQRSLIDDYGVDPKRAVVCSLGIRREFDAEPIGKRYDGRTILFVGKGNFDGKGGNVVLQAFRRVRESVPDARLIIVGQDNTFAGEHGVESMGRVSDAAELHRLHLAAHVFVLPSYIDRFGMSLVEAMAAGTPCIAANYGAQPDIVGEAGFIVEPGDHRAAAEHLTRLLTDTALSEQLGEKARRRYSEKFSWDANAPILRRAIGMAAGGSDGADKRLSDSALSSTNEPM